MVSTRNTKDKFCDGERVLCYEPDSRKAKVLYDSKVLEVKVGKDVRGRKTVEYLIHFQGWNSSWDRLVSEDFVLKDTDENRQLQRDLAANARLQIGAYLYRKDLSEKEGPTLSDSGRAFEAGNSCSSHDVLSAEEHDAYLTATDDDDKESSVDTDDSLEQKVPLDLSPTMRTFLDTDFDLIHRHQKLVKLPASPNVVQILEGYVRYFCSRVLRRDGDESPRPRSGRQPATPARPLGKTEELEWICARVNLVKEMVEGLRVCFDCYLGSQLLYASEQPQYNEVKNGTILHYRDVKPECSSEDDGSRSDDPFLSGHEFNLQIASDAADAERRRSLRSHKDPVMEASSSATLNGTNKLTARNLGSIGGPGSLNNCSARSCSSTASSYCGPLAGHAAHMATGASGPLVAEIAKLMALTSTWRLVPDKYLFEHPQPPSTVYGAIHLARLFVKLPSFLYAANLPDKENHPRNLSEHRLVHLLHHLQSFLMFLETKPEWFSEEHYVSNPTNVEF